MNKQNAETKVFINALRGKVKVVSSNGQLHHILDSLPAERLSYEKIKHSLDLLTIIEKLKLHRNNSLSLRKTLIQLKIDSLLHTQ